MHRQAIEAVVVDVAAVRAEEKQSEELLIPAPPGRNSIRVQARTTVHNGLSVESVVMGENFLPTAVSRFVNGLCWDGQMLCGRPGDRPALPRREGIERKGRAICVRRPLSPKAVTRPEAAKGHDDCGRISHLRSVSSHPVQIHSHLAGRSA